MSCPPTPAAFSVNGGQRPCCRSLDKDPGVGTHHGLVPDPTRLHPGDVGRHRQPPAGRAQLSQDLQKNLEQATADLRKRKKEMSEF